MIRGSDYQTLVLSSCTAGFFSGMFTNVLEVLKTQIMNDAMHSHNRGGLHFRHFSSRLADICRCYYCFIRNRFREHGAKMYFRGIWYNTSMSMMRSSILFPLYELGNLS